VTRFSNTWLVVGLVLGYTAKLGLAGIGSTGDPARQQAVSADLSRTRGEPII